jgi:molybdenum cofactor synthesis domain-containing protein
MTERKEFRDLSPAQTARDAIASLDLGGEREAVPIEDARGRVLAERIDADLDVPGFDRASKDGYAVQARDTFGAEETDPVVLDLVGTVHAGQAPDLQVESGTAVEISTGAVLPDGADAVVMVERTDERDDGLAVRKSVTPSENVMFAGADVAAGERALGPGTKLTAREIGLLSALGRETVPVRSKPTVGIVSTGEELVRPGGDLDHDAGQIYDVNSYTIASGVEAAGGDPIVYPHAGDDLAELESVLTDAAETCDLVLSSGSTSASAVDVIYRVIEQQGELLAHGLAVKPGRPTIIGRFADAAYIGLPGYPVSALTIFRTFVAPAIREAAGLPEPTTATVSAEMAVRERYAEGRLWYLPVGLIEDGDGQTLAYPVNKGSGATTSLVAADGVVAMEPETAQLDVGESVTVQLFSPDVRPPTLFGVGEDDPAMSRLLDHVDRPRYLSEGSRAARRRLRDGVPDVGVIAGPDDAPDDAVTLGEWSREWGLVVPAGNPEGVDGVAALVDRTLTFANRDANSGLRAAFDAALEDLADDRGTARSDLAAAIDGYDLTLRGHESPARRVASGRIDVGLGLAATAARLDVGFVSLGTQRVRVVANPDRVTKPGVDTLERTIGDHASVFDALAGFELIE